MGSRALPGCTCAWLPTLLIPRWLVSGTAVVVPPSDPQDAASVGPSRCCLEFLCPTKTPRLRSSSFSSCPGKHSWVHCLLSPGDCLSVRQGENPLRNVPSVRQSLAAARLPLQENSGTPALRHGVRSGKLTQVAGVIVCWSLAGLFRFTCFQEYINGRTSGPRCSAGWRPHLGILCHPFLRSLSLVIYWAICDARYVYSWGHLHWDHNPL